MTRTQAAAEIVRLGDIIRAYQAVGWVAPAPIANGYGEAVAMYDLLSSRPHIPAPRASARRPITAGRNR